MATSLENRLASWLTTFHHKRKLQDMVDMSRNIATVEVSQKRPTIRTNSSSLTLAHLLHYYDHVPLNQLLSGNTINLNIHNGELQSSMNTIELDSDAAAAAPLPSGWEKCLDLKTGSFYYFNRGTGMSTHCDPRLEKGASGDSSPTNGTAVIYMRQENHGSPLTHTFTRPSSPNSNSSSELTCEPAAAGAITLRNKGHHVHHHTLHCNRQDERDQEEASVAVMAAHAAASPPVDINLDLNLSLGGTSISPPTSNAQQSLHHDSTADDKVSRLSRLSKSPLQSTSSSSSPIISSSPSSLFPSPFTLPSTSPSPSLLSSSLSSPLSSLAPWLSITSSATMSSPLPSSLSSPLLSSSTSCTVPQQLSSDRSLSSPSLLGALSRDRHQSIRLPASISSHSSLHGCNIETSNDSNSMVTMACSHCLMFVMLSTSNPKCPRCGTAYSPHHHHDLLQARLPKKPRLEFLL